MNLQHDYWSEKYETNTPGVYVLVVTYDPAMIASRRDERATARRQRLAQQRIEKRNAQRRA
jgi:adenylate kinase